MEKIVARKILSQQKKKTEIARATHNFLQRIKSSKNDYQKSNQ
jgi:hypothetical protein